MDPIVLAFTEIAAEEGNTASIEAIRNAAFAKLVSGERKTLINSSLNGKSFSYAVSLPADKLFTLASQAIRLFNRGIITTTTLDFLWV